ncbi:ABC transporter ATP-binding protein [Neoroseomonas oryzicola]|uniref:ABC transporter ATP-binding protein n=1 Tax=Neoroseomonas oryzicola TaxID=535904 RepID=A0A9X9WCY4_9PROT|nr:ABC transporter ATP-binding protein [Neoroseomonas oryzicola]MBR0658194.1 ABC transporter ATP-binding protein [Neoroseomonas oryzicola]NKE15989.1 ABC transporter ATP-binding protein [Neoroseomonas oryzicola]
MTALLRAEAITKRFGPTLALDALDLEIGQGEFFALLGGSGSGKSTLLRIIAGFETPDSGRLLLDGTDIAATPPWARPVNMMFQSYALFPHMSVADNVAYGLRRAGAPKAEAASRIATALAMVGLSGFERRRPHELSGGQKQRVALARSLVMRPRLLLLDEPLGALDAGLRERTGFELRALQRETGAAFVMVTHDQEEALALADRVALLDGGRIAQVGPPREIYERPASRFVARFLGAANVLEGRAAQDRFDCPDAGITCAGAIPADTVAIALRPERIRIAAAGEGPNTARGIVQDVAFRGDDSLVLVDLGGGTTLRVAHPEEGGPPPARGAAVTLAWEAADVVPLAS